MQTKDKIWYLEHFDILQRLNKDDMMRMEKTMLMRVINKNSVLHFPELTGRYVYFLKEGVIKISSQDNNGNEFIKYIVKPGCIFGEMSLLEGKEDDNDFATAMEDCVVCFIDVESLKAMMQMHADLNIRIRKLIGLRIKKVENRLMSLVFKDAATRVFDFLKEFVTEFGIAEADGLKAKLFLTQDDIAKLTATTRQTVVGVMTALRNNNQIDYNQRFVKVYFKNLRMIA